MRKPPGQRRLMGIVVLVALTASALPAGAQVPPLTPPDTDTEGVQAGVDLDRDGDSEDAADLAHAPIATAYVGQPITVAATQRCELSGVCAAALYYRATANDPQILELPASAGWTRVEMDRTGEQAVALDEDLIDWAATIPAQIVSTTGVDYFIQTIDDTYQGRFPAGVDDTTLDVGQWDPGVTWWHVQTLAPPLLVHTPPAFGIADEPLPLSLRATCSTGECTATVYWRTTDGPLTDEPFWSVPPDWASATMSAVGAPVPVGDVGQAQEFSFAIPASYVDTRGVDYFFHVTDGQTNAWWPGTTYEGYYAPVDGVRTGYHHVHAMEPPHIVHAPVPAVPYRSEVPVAGQANCPTDRTCTATLYWRTTTTHLWDPEAVFESAPMTVRVVAQDDPADVIEVEGVIPAAFTDTRGVDYFFSVSDGSTVSWWPGTTHVDGYVPVDGTQVGYAHVRVLDPPHIVPTHAPTVRALSDYTVTALVTCATETCDVTLHYRTDDDGLNFAEVPEKVLAMTPVGEPLATPAGLAQTWAATIPAPEVTTVGLAFWVHATDGYTDSYSPGNDYWGAYLPTGGARPRDVGTEIRLNGVNVDVGPYNYGVGTPVQGPRGPADVSHWVRVLEPPHPVHVPPAVVGQGQPVDVDVYANCTTQTCTAELLWWDGQTWLPAPMTGGPVTTAVPSVPDQLLTAEDVWAFAGTIPREGNSRPLVYYRFVVDDGYVRAATPAYYVAASDQQLNLGAVDGVVFHDRNGDGVQQGGTEQGLRYSLVQLEHAGLDGQFGTLDDLETRYASTDGNGAWQFDRLGVGRMRVQAFPPDGLAVTPTSPTVRTTSLTPLSMHESVHFGFRGRTVPELRLAATTSTTGADQVQVRVTTNPGILPGDIHIARDNDLARMTPDALASNVYDVTVPAGVTVNDAAITIPYRADVLDGYPAEQLQILSFDETIGLWVDPGVPQAVDTTARTVTAQVEHFSRYAVFKTDHLRQTELANRLFCVDRDSADRVRLDVAFLMDASGSMTSSDPTNQRIDAALTLVDAMRDDDRAAVISFNSRASEHEPIRPLDAAGGRTRIVNALQRLRDQASGGTSLTAGMEQVTDTLTADPAVSRARVAILLSDGHDGLLANYNHDTTTQAAADNNVVVFAIGLGTPDDEFLTQIAERTGGRYYDVSDADDLEDTFAQLTRLIVDDGADDDGDGLTNCQETVGMLTSTGLWDQSADPADNPLSLARVTTSPDAPDTDDDDLSDGQEMLGREPSGDLGSPIDITDYTAIVGFEDLIDAGVTRLFSLRSDPNTDHSDGDGIDDRRETEGIAVATGDIYDSDPTRNDTDFDGNHDDREYANSTDPRTPDDNELGIPGLPRYTLFISNTTTFPDVVDADLADVCGPPICLHTVEARQIVPVTYDRTAPVLYDADSFACISNCAAIRAHATSMPGSGCWGPFSSSCTVGDRERQIVQDAVERQRILTRDGLMANERLTLEALVQCSVEHATPAECDARDHYASFGDVALDIAADIVSEMVLSIPGGYRPEELCAEGSGREVVYRLVEIATSGGQSVEVNRYIGQTGNDQRRSLQHERSIYPERRGLRFEAIHRSPNRELRRGLEQHYYEQYWAQGEGNIDIQTAKSRGSYNRQRPISPRRAAVYDARMKLAREYLEQCT